PEDPAPGAPPATARDGLPQGSPAADRARSLVVPVPQQEGAPAVPAPAVAPVLPGRPDTDRPHVRAPAARGTGDGPPCAWCATPNRPDRHFCDHCAMPLAESGDAPAPGPRPWWRRLLGPGGQEAPRAGDRPRLRRVFDRVGTWVSLAVAVTLIVLGVLYAPDGVQATRDHFAKRAPVQPDEIRASRSYPDHGPKLAIDKLNNTWWGPGVSQSGEGEWIEMRFARPARLLDVIITPGTSTRADQLEKSALPHRVRATVTKKNSGTETRELVLDPGAGGQRRAFRVGEVTAVRFTIESAHAASADKQVAVAEIELFGRSGGGLS
ncbi:NADase-type glycan-binding domain-containing protein, partial [Streptomyces stramineus]